MQLCQFLGHDPASIWRAAGCSVSSDGGRSINVRSADNDDSGYNKQHQASSGEVRKHAAEKYLRAIFDRRKHWCSTLLL